MAHCIPSWTLASGLVALGMDWKQAVFTIALANIIVLLPMLATGHAGPKYGIPFPVLARASFGLRGANIPALIRAAVGLRLVRHPDLDRRLRHHSRSAPSSPAVAGRTPGRSRGNPWPLWLCFVLFWALQIAIIYRGMDFLRHFENWAAPFVIVGALVLLIWIAVKADGFGALLDQPSKLGWGPDFWPVFFPSLMGMIGFWATLSLNIPDFTRFGASQKAQTWGQSLGLPTTMTLFAFLAVLVTSGSEAVYGEAIWDPVAARRQDRQRLRSALRAGHRAGRDPLREHRGERGLTGLRPVQPRAAKLINFRTGALDHGCPRHPDLPVEAVSPTPEFYIFTWLGLVGGLLGTVAGILIADYWIIRRTVLHLADLYTPGRPLLVRRTAGTGGRSSPSWSAVSSPSAARTSTVADRRAGPVPDDG